MAKKRLLKAMNKEINSTYKPLFHLAPPFGWLNDPNGFCYFQGAYHLFYQHNPYSSNWGRMHWGHATSKDLISWTHMPIALFPDTKYDSFLGCFSGSAIENNDKLFLIYTGVPFLKQHQMLAESSDGTNFCKHTYPVIPIKDRPPLCGKFSFRDPKVFRKNNAFYTVIGASHKKGRQIVLYKSNDLFSWEYIGFLIADKEKTAGIFECPDLIFYKDNELLIYSVMYTKTNDMEYQNLHSSVYQIGNIDLLTGHFDAKTEPKELDCGCDFYAPQTVQTPDGRTICTAWMQMWLRSNPTHYLGHGWQGAMTLPRELTVKNGILYQKPIQEVYKYFDNITKYKPTIEGNKTFEGVKGENFYLKVELEEIPKNFYIHLRENGDNYSVISIAQGIVTFDREKSGYPIKGKKLDGNLQCSPL